MFRGSRQFWNEKQDNSLEHLKLSTAEMLGKMEKHEEPR